MARKLTLVVSRDEYELPLGVFESAAAAARFAGINKSSLTPGHNIDPGIRKGVKFITVEEDDDE